MSCETVRLYRVQFAEGLLDPRNRTLAEQLGGRRALFVTTPTVARLYGDALAAYIETRALDATVMVLPCSEDRKTLEEVAQICTEALARGLDRRSVLVAFGGGVVMDIVSVAASSIRRGIPFVRIPTTLIGQIDAGIGLKGAVNFNGKKSYLGCFHPPEAVFVCPSFLHTLSTPHLQSGFAEIIKMAVVRDEELFQLVAQHHAGLLETRFAHPMSERVLWLSCQRMLEELELNPYEDKTYKRLVDMGHTFSPALEAAARFTIQHGPAVAIDTALTVTLAERLGYLSRRDRDRVVSLIHAVGLPVSSSLMTEDLCMAAAEDAVLHRAGALNLVMPVRIGEAVFLEHLEDLPREVLSAALGEIASISNHQAVEAA